MLQVVRHSPYHAVVRRLWHCELGMSDAGLLGCGLMEMFRGRYSEQARYTIMPRETARSGENWVCEQLSSELYRPSSADWRRSLRESQVFPAHLSAFVSALKYLTDSLPTHGEFSAGCSSFHVPSILHVLFSSSCRTRFSWVASLRITDAH
ncbi:hypothetical protein K458DRAFT_40995 [Lentithecium fluviatile CBS 122367]|uniref:Uncharacterized protein n=1 Tax=Lentithecium fluviatile CBS 122367 TaxID=1168545 RepID=A0A6G1J0K9_9PLEO|nr:hypothetical protein K458DRAFT_40995 [Lentithecium fluviatile CBS 122367]